MFVGRDSLLQLIECLLDGKDPVSDTLSAPYPTGSLDLQAQSPSAAASSTSQAKAAAATASELGAAATRGSSPSRDNARRQRSSLVRVAAGSASVHDTVALVGVYAAYLVSVHDGQHRRAFNLLFKVNQFCRDVLHLQDEGDRSSFEEEDDDEGSADNMRQESQ